MIEVSRKKSPAFEFLEGKSFLHRLNPGLKLLFIAASSVLVLGVSSLWPMLLAAGLLVALFAGAGVSAQAVRRDLSIVIYQLTMTIPLALISSGFTWNAAMIVLITTLRFAVMIGAASLVMRTTNPWLLFKTLRPLLGERMAFLALLSVRYVPVLSGELTEIHALQAARAHNKDTGVWRNLLRGPESLLIPYAQRSVRLAEDIAVAAHARGIVPVVEQDEDSPGD